MSETKPSVLETPSGKDVSYENFPVGSWLLSRRVRLHVLCFYRFARAADDIADNEALSVEEKIARLDRFGDALSGREMHDSACETAHKMRESLVVTGVSPQHCADLLTAFKLDATKLRYRNWDDLIGYCTLSAVPVGRYLLDLHGGSRDDYVASDALCLALQVINHLQDCRDDYLKLNRVYLPQDWMDVESVSLDSLGQTHTNPQLRAVFDRVIVETRALLTIATTLPAGLVSRRLAMESGATLTVAWRLVRLLEQKDPLMRRIGLTKPRFLLCCIGGALRGLVS